MMSQNGQSHFKNPWKTWKTWSDMICLNRPYHSKLFKGWIPRILRCPFLNAPSHNVGVRTAKESWRASFFGLFTRKDFTSVPNQKYVRISS